MALTRSMLKGMGLTDEQVGAIIDEHAATVDGLKADRDKYKEDAERLPKVQKELDDLKSGNSGWEEKYNAEHDAFEKYKSEVADKERSAAVEKAYRKLLKDAGVGEKHIDSIIRVTDFKNMELNKGGGLKDADKLAESVKSDYSGFITSTETKGKDVDNPPDGEKKTKTKDEILAIKDASERQKAMAENHELFGI